MLNRFRDFVKRLELPQEGEDVIYRILDGDLNAVEVTQSQYARWRMQNDVADRAVVGQDTVGNVRVRTTFSIMPENRGYKPFGTSAFDMASLDPLVEHSRRYDTWAEAQRGHRDTLDHIRREIARARATDERAEALSGTAGEVRLAISADLPALFRVDVRSEGEVAVETPLLRADGTSIQLSVLATAAGFSLRAPVEVEPSNSVLTLSQLRSEQVERICGAMGVTLEDGTLTCKLEDASQLGHAIVRLSQALACLTYVARERR